MGDVAGASSSLVKEVANESPCEKAVTRFRKLLRDGETVPPDQLAEFGWNIPLVTTCEPSTYCIPQEVFNFHPQENDVFKIFFKGTSKEVRIRQIFFHTPLTAEEQQWLVDFRAHCANARWKIPLFMESMVLRIIWLAYRKYGDNVITRSFELAKMMVEWREGFFPLNDQEEEMRAMLDKGVMFWVGRDQSLRPLLVIKLSRLHKSASPEVFKRLTIFCFEWGLRYLMIPGIVETITVLLDVRGVPLHQFPISALTDMTNTLTKQYPFRLNRMLIINDSFFVQTVWNIAKQFLTEVQQQKMQFFRTGFEEELRKEYTPWQLESCYGGTRPEITTFYPFPIAPGPYTVGSVQSSDPYKDGYRATDRVTSYGVLWEKDCRMPIQWAPEAAKVFTDLSLPLPEGLEPWPAAAVDEDKDSTEKLAEDVSSSAATAVAAAEPESARTNSEAVAPQAESGVAAAQAPETAGKDEQSQPVQKQTEREPEEALHHDGDGAASELAPGENADINEEQAEERKKLTTVDAASAPEQMRKMQGEHGRAAICPASADQEPDTKIPEPETKSPEENKVSADKTQPAVEKVGKSKCCSRCSVQ